MNLNRNANPGPLPDIDPTAGGLRALASGLSHELNNVLTTLLGHLAIVRSESPAAPTTDASFAAIAQTTDSLAYISRCLRQLGDSLQHVATESAEEEVKLLLARIHRLRDEPAPARAAAPPPAAITTERRRAFVCVAEPQVRRLIVSALRERPLDVSADGSFQQLELFLRSPENSGQVAFVDFDGLDSLERLRFFDLLGHSARIHIVVMTAQSEVESAIQANSHCRTLKKPFKVAALLECVS